MREVTTLTGLRLATEVKNKFGDTGAVQITNDMILSWINNGVRAIVAQAPYLRSTAVSSLIAGQSVYALGTAFPAARIMQYDAVVANGRKLKFMPFAEYQTLMDERLDTPGQPTIATEYGGTLTLWPTPEATVSGGLVLYFSAYPEEMTELEALLPVPDRFYNALLDFVHAQALELDDEFEAAQSKLSQHEVHLQRQFERENRSPTDWYPAISMDPDDGLRLGGDYFD